MTPKYLVVHTAAFRGKNCDAARIDGWHRERGWNGIGYHYVILNDKHDSKPDGLVEPGRPENISGAHARGINSQSLGICCVGHGDHNDFTQKQYESLYNLLEELADRYDIQVENIIGHRELNNLIGRGLLDDQYQTHKSCPGNMVDMTGIREVMKRRLSSETDTEESTNINDIANNQEVVNAISVLKQHRDDFTNAKDELNEFLFHPEVLEILEDHK